MSHLRLQFPASWLVKQIAKHATNLPKGIAMNPNTLRHHPQKNLISIVARHKDAPEEGLPSLFLCMDADNE